MPGEHVVGVGTFGYVCLYWFTAWPGRGYIRALGKLVRSLTRLSSIYLYLYYYFRLNEDSSHMDVLSSLISRRETHDATSDVTKRLATAVVWHVSVLVDSSENSAIIMYNITEYSHFFSMNDQWFSTYWSVSKTPQKPTRSYTPMHGRWDHLLAGYLLGNAGATIQ